MENAVGIPQTAVVFGGSSEIGLAAMEDLVARGLRRIVLAVRSPGDATDAGVRLKQAGAELVDVIGFEARDFDSHERVLAEVTDRIGDIDLALLAFGVLGDEEVFEAEPARAVAAVQTNYVGAVSLGLHLARVMRSQGHGVITVLSSVAGVRVRRANLVYGSSKAGLDGFAQGLRDALDGSGARVMIVRPGFVRTRMTEGMQPAPLSVTADEVARDLVAGLERGSDVVWSPPILRYVFTTLRHLPAGLWRRMPR